jgi:hypothetical protein
MNGTDRKDRVARRRTLLGGRASAKVAGVLAAASLAIPAGAAGYAVPADPTGPSNAATTHKASGLVLHRDGSKAVPFVADVSGRDAAPGGGFDWGDALIGAGAAALGIAAIGGVGLTMRRREPADARSALSGS